MPTEAQPRPVQPRRGPIRAPQEFVAGLALIGLALFAVWAISNLPQGTLRAMGPAMLPRWLAIGVALCGALLVAGAFISLGPKLQRWSLRGPLFVMAGIFAFALTIRPFTIGGGVTTPGLGLIVAGPLAIFIGGFATSEVRPRDLAILALALTPFCMILFGDLLNLPIPVFPQSMAQLFPSTWSQKDLLRATAAIMASAAAVVFLLGRTFGRRREPDRIDVAPPTGTI